MSPSEKTRRGPAGGGSAARKSGSPPAVRRALRRGPAYYQSRLVLGPLNYGLMSAGLISIVAGFLLLARRETSLSPALLVLGYCILIPASLLLERVPGRPGPGQMGPTGEGE